MQNEMTVNDLADLKAHEKIIETTKGAWVECGLALSKIKDAKLYRQGFKTFEAYCKERWGWGRSYAYQLIGAAQVVCTPIGVQIKNEAQARALADIPEEEREAAMQRAEESGEVTATSISNAGKLKPDKIINLDKTGWPIPDNLMPIWDRSSEVQEMITALGRIKSIIKKAQEDKDILYRDLNYSGCLSHLENSQRVVKTALPFAVCWTCSGKNSSKCTMCKGIGLVSEFSWESFAPKEVKVIRSKAIAKVKK